MIRVPDPRGAGATPPRRVVIAGGGIAGIEAALAVRAFTGGAASVVVVDPGRRFTIPGTATARAFGKDAGVDLPLAHVVRRAGATLLNGRVAAVDPERRLVTLDGGEVVTYDALVVAVGARPVAAVPGALTFRGAADIDAVRGMAGDIGRRGRRGADVRLAVVVPPGCGWPLAAYELALLTREHLAARDPADPVSISIVTSEEAPLGLFGPGPSATVMAKLERARIHVRTGVTARSWTAGRLGLADGGSIWADRVIALPVYRGPAIDGLPADDEGFIPAAPDGRLPGAPGVWAVGDGTSNPVKQGGIACRQADAAAADIAAHLGTPVGDPPDGATGPAALAWPVAKVSGRFLAPFLRALVEERSPTGPVGVPS
ncbi:MAG: NAD(P)/FAD-dependent oxidoreductase [Solirubrobacterales bacterium]